MDMVETQVPIPGFTPDPENPNAGLFTNIHGQSERVFLKHSRTPERHATEMAALALLRKQSGDLPTPRLISEHSDDSGSILILSYEAGVNLADLLSPTPAAPPRPPWYTPFHLPVNPSLKDLMPLLTEIGRAVRIMHAIRIDKFGKLVGQEPNPHRWNARAFTQQEFTHRIQVGVEKGFLPPPIVQEIKRWISHEINCLSETEPSCFVHYDLHAGNVRVFNDPATDTWRLRTIYDLELARGWLPEWDLAALLWDLKFLEDDEGLAWHSFLDGYGPVDPMRLRLFEGLRAVSAIAYTDRYPEWGVWSLAFLNELLNGNA